MANPSAAPTAAVKSGKARLNAAKANAKNRSILTNNIIGVGKAVPKKGK